MSSNLFSGHGSNLFSLKSLISSVIGFGAACNPSKDAIRIDALQTKLAEGYNAVLAVNKIHPDFKNAVSDRDLAFRSVNTHLLLKNARIARNNVLYAQVTGLVHIGLDAKNYIISVFGVKSPQYQQVAKLKFTIYKS